MKRGLRVFVGLACFFVMGLPVFSQPSSKSIMTVMMIGCARTLLALGVSFNFFIWALVFSTITEEIGLSPM